MLHRSYGLRRPKSQKRPVDRNRTLRSEWLEERWLLSGYGLSGVGLGALLASASNSAQGPAIVTPATASLASTGKTAVLSVAASDSAAASSLVYTWSVVSGPAHGAATFQSNGSNGAKTETVTFSGAGTYDLAVRVTDPKALAATSSVYVTVSQVVNSIVLTPSSVSLATGGSQQFSASALDQFGIAMATPPAFTWSATAGTISSKGLYTASNVSDSKVTITAHSGAISSTAAAVVGHAPTISKAATATLNSTATGAALSIGATDDIGGSDLNYNWSVLSAPAGGTANFSVSGGNAAKNTTVTFNKAGTYSLQVVLSEPNGLFAASSVSVNVTAAPSHIAVTPATIGLNAASKQQFAASESDQFGNVLAAQPTFSWSASTGSINTTGLFTAPAAIGSVTVTAHAGSLSGTATVTVKNAVAIAAPAAATLNRSATGAALSVAASDGIGASDLSYQWSLTSAPGGGKAVFSVNGSNAANANTVTFNEAGTYTLLATATGSGGASAASSVSVTVAPLASSITVTPGTLMLNANNQQFTASASDQFGNTLAVQPTFSWTASAGTISASGLFMPTAAGSVTVTAGSGSLKGTATVTVQSFLSIVTPATVTLNSFQHGGTLSAQATDAAGGSDLSYRWTVLSAPAGASPSLGVGSSATSLYLDEAGDYTFQATITASGGLSVTSSVSVNVPQNLDGVYPTPCFVTLGAGSNQQFQGCSEDQFGRPMAIQPSFTWSASDGTISPTGLFTAPLAGGSLNVYVSSGSFTGWATVTVLNTVSITTSAAAALSSSGTTAALSVAANDTLGGSDLNYVWTVTSEPAGNWAYLFSDNNSNTAKNTTITFRAAGTYILQATATGSGGATATSSVTVNVAALPTSVAVTPAKTTLNAGSSQQFAASQHDQFGHATAVQPAFTWSTSAGSITASGMFTAPAAPGTVTVTAQSGSFTGTAAVTLNNYVTIATPAAATLNGTTTGAALSVLATDDVNDAALKYLWYVTSAPAGGTATVGDNGDNSAKNTTVTFDEAGSYTLEAIVSDTSGVTATSSVTFVVAQVASSITVTRGLNGVINNASDVFTAIARDQFGGVMAKQPGFTWSATGCTINNGTITPPTAVGTYSVTAQAGLLSGTTTFVIKASATATLVTPAAATLNSAMTGATLSVAATDSNGGGDLCYTWYMQSGPTNGAVIFGVNGCNASQNTTVIFNEAGTYLLRVSINTSGRSIGGVSSPVTVTVGSVPGSIDVTPSTASIAAGGTQQFSARELDQFGSVMAEHANVTWSASAGTINSNCVYTAPATAENVTVTAKVGSLTCTAHLTVAGGVPLNLHDQGLMALVESLDADGSISRQDMLTIFNSVEINNLTLSASELADLQSLVADAASLNMPDYVRVLAADVVDGNPANGSYQGQPLGNLAAGSTTTQLNTLVGKWFLGTDVPAATICGPYALVNGTLFGSGGPAYTDVQQGALGDCYFLSALGAIARSSPTAIENMIIPNGDGTYTVRFYAGAQSYTPNSDGSYTESFVGTGTADYVTVNSMLPTNGANQLVFDGYGNSIYANNTLWLPLIEKAYAQWNQTGREWRDLPDTGLNNYSNMNGGWMSDVSVQVLGQSSIDYSPTQSDAMQSIIAALAANKAVTAGTIGSTAGDDSLPNGLYGSHAYDVTAYDANSGTFTLFNPWGDDQPRPLTWSELAAECDLCSVTNPSDTSPMSAVKAANAAAASTANPSSPAAFDAWFANYGKLLHSAGMQDTPAANHTARAAEELSAARLLVPWTALAANPSAWHNGSDWPTQASAWDGLDDASQLTAKLWTLGDSALPAEGS